jgi:hypothetical protein
LSARTSAQATRAAQKTAAVPFLKRGFPFCVLYELFTELVPAVQGNFWSVVGVGIGIGADLQGITVGEMI